MRALATRHGPIGLTSTRNGPRDQLGALKRGAEHTLFGILPPVLLALALLIALRGGYAVGDLRHTFLIAAWRALHGANPYSWTKTQITQQIAFPYPAPTLLALAPLALLPVTVASCLYLAFCVCCIPLALWLLDVRDWRLYGLAVLFSPVLVGIQTGNLTIPILLGVAALWRWRDRPLVAGGLLALLVAFKPIMFPLGLWLLATRRYRATAIAVSACLLVSALAWTVLGWHLLGPWLHLVGEQSRLMYRDGYGLVALLAHLGAGRTAGTIFTIGAGLGAAVGCVVLGRTDRTLAAFGVAVLMLLICSPKIDQHYFALMLVPLALGWRRLSWAWALPVALWLCPASGGGALQIALWWVTALALSAAVAVSS